MQFASCHSIEKLSDSSELMKITNKNNFDSDEIDTFLQNLFNKIVFKRQKNRKKPHRVFKKSYLDGGLLIS